MKTFILAALISIGLIAPALTHEGATGIVKERMDLMKVIADNTKKVAPIAMGAAELDLKAVEAAAQAISEASKVVIHKFPEGSVGHVSEAKPEIWQDWAKFEALMRGMAESADQLVATAQSGDGTDLQAQFEELAKNCKQCHTSFRQKKH